MTLSDVKGAKMNIKLFFDALMELFAIHIIRAYLTFFRREVIYHALRMIVEVDTQGILMATLSEDPFIAGNLISTLVTYIIIQMYKRCQERDFTTPLSFAIGSRSTMLM